MARDTAAYLRLENWPDCIPATEPTREFAPAAWRPPDHDPEGVDDYPWSHPSAASVGDSYMGDVCPYCGVPLSIYEIVTTLDNETGRLHAVSPDDTPKPCYHRACWLERRGHGEATLDEFIEVPG